MGMVVGGLIKKYIFYPQKRNPRKGLGIRGRYCRFDYKYQAPQLHLIYLAYPIYALCLHVLWPIILFI